MVAAADALARFREASQRVVDLEDMLRQARGLRAEALRAVQSAGDGPPLSLRALAGEVGLSLGGVQALLKVEIDGDELLDSALRILVGSDALDAYTADQVARGIGQERTTRARRLMLGMKATRPGWGLTADPHDRALLAHAHGYAANLLAPRS